MIPHERWQYLILTLFVLLLVSIIVWLFVRYYCSERDHFTFTVYEDGGFVIYEHGLRIGTGCLDQQLCDDTMVQSRITVYSEP
jgi:hypothetical protein